MVFCTVIGCMDGRVQGPVMAFVAAHYGYDCPDTITDPGPIKDLSDTDNQPYFNRVCERIDISVNKHGSRHIFVVGHDDCAGNPVKRPGQEEQLRSILPRLQQRYPDCQVTALYVNDQWQCEVLDVKTI